MSAVQSRQTRIKVLYNSTRVSVYVYNTLTQQKELFEPWAPPQVHMYVCGVTVYDHCHLGHARAYAAFDLVRRHLEYRGYRVTHVQNFTDVDDKIIARAQELGVAHEELTRTYEDAYFAAMDALGVNRAQDYPRATQSMPQIIAMIVRLLDQGYAYEVNGSVYFSIAHYAPYGQLSKRDRKQMEAGARVEVDTHKKDPLDFVLWKPQKAGEPAWDSPWGLGRPGWHIECSAMATAAFGPRIDIHAGGQDLIFPHHENEIAQSEAATGQKPFAKYWLHNGFVTLDKQKMSKSLGNVFTLRELYQRYDPNLLRFFLLRVHYRHPIHFSTTQIEEDAAALKRLSQAAHEFTQPAPEAMHAEFQAQFDAALDDDFNSTEAMAVLFNACREVNKLKKGGPLLSKLAKQLGLDLPKEESTLDPRILELLKQRAQARAEKNFMESDRLRDLLKQRGVLAKDTPQGQKWERV